METELYYNLWNEFLEKEHKIFLKGKRKYLHFDNKIGFDELLLQDYAKFEKIFNDRFKENFHIPTQLLKSGFYPFIQVEKIVPRYKFDEKKGHKTTVPKKRYLNYASHFDALRYSWYSTILNHCYEGTLKNEEYNKSILAYRKLSGKASNIEFAFEAFKEIQKRKTCTALAFDITKFFDTINHNVLKSNWIQTLKYIYPDIAELPKDHFKIYKNITQFQFVPKNILDEVFADFIFYTDKRTRYCSPKDFREYIKAAKLINTNPCYKKNNTLSGGIPQGSPISAVLANISMMGFDKKMYNYISKFDGKYFRYSDDLLIIIKSEYTDEIKLFAQNLVNEINLQFNDKTEIINFIERDGNIVGTNEKGNSKKLQYLGFEFDGKEAYIRSSSLSKYHAAMKRGIRKAVSMAFGKFGDGKRVFKSKLLKKYTQSGNNNFIHYAKRANEKKEGDKTIQHQYKKQYNHLNKSIKKRKEAKLRKRRLD